MFLYREGSAEKPCGYFVLAGKTVGKKTSNTRKAIEAGTDEAAKAEAVKFAGEGTKFVPMYSADGEEHEGGIEIGGIALLGSLE